MVFRKDSKVDAFQRQIGALRQQLGVAGESDPQGPRDDSPEPDQQVHRAPPERATEHREREQPTRPSSTIERPESSPFSFRAPEQHQEQRASVSAAELSPSVVTRDEVDAQTTVIAANTSWRGDLETDGSMHIHGRAEGSITARRDVFVAEEADVNVSLAAGDVIVAGLIRGTVRCAGRFEVLAHGRVMADVHAPTLVVHDGARVSGQLRMGPLEVGKVNETPSPSSTTVERRVAHAGS